MTCKLYRHFSSDGKLLYIGIAINVLARTYSHNYSHWTNEISKIEIEHHRNRVCAEHAERMAIKKEKPIYNVKQNENNINRIPPPIRAGQLVSLLVRSGFKQKDLAILCGASISKINRLHNGHDYKICSDAYTKLLKFYEDNKGVKK